MPDPSILVTLHSPRRSRLWLPLAELDASMCWSRSPNLVREASTGVSERDRITDGSQGEASPSLGYPTDVVVEQVYDPQDWEAHGDGAAARRSPSRTPSSRQGRSVRATSTSACPVSCSPVRRRSPASACRWCSCRASSPRERSRPVRTRHRVDPVVRSARHFRTSLRIDRIDASAPDRVHASEARRRRRRMLVPDRPRHARSSRYALCREFNKRHGTTYYWSTQGAPDGSSNTTCMRCTRSLATPTTSSTRFPSQGGRDVPTEVRAQTLRSRDFGDRFFSDLDTGHSPTIRC